MPELNEDPVPDVSSYQVRYTERVIQHALGVTAYHIGLATRKYSHLYVVIVLDGALYVGADLTRCLHPNVTIGFVKASSYGDNKEAGDLHVEFVGDTRKWNLQEQAVLIIDDIYDTGNTMEKLKGLFMQMGAKTVYSAVLLYREKMDTDEDEFTKVRKPDFAAFTVHGNEFFVGYGLDDKHRARNMRSVYTIPPLEFEEESK